MRQSAGGDDHLVGMGCQHIRRIGETFEQDKQRKALVVMATGAGKTRTVIALADLLVRPCVQSLGNLLELMANSLSAVRPGRSFPRKRKRAASRGCEGYKPTR